MSESGGTRAASLGVIAGGGSGQLRKIHVVYFLSRNGRTEQPHLIRVNHQQQCRGGVRLRDVKRWLSDIRGKDMPAAFAWSYKRRYKAGYVWQDLMTNDDLITPVADNEYLLKGSSTSCCSCADTAESPSPTTVPGPHCSTKDVENPASALTLKQRLYEMEAAIYLKENDEENHDADHANYGNMSSNTPLRHDEDDVTRSSSTSSSSTSSAASSFMAAWSAVSDASTQTPATPSLRRAFRLEFVDDDNEISQHKDQAASVADGCRSVTSSSSDTMVALLPPLFRKSRTYPRKGGGGGGAAQVLRSLLTCRTVDVSESVLLHIGRRWPRDDGNASDGGKQRTHRREDRPRSSFSGSSSRSRSGEAPGRPSSTPSSTYRAATMPFCSQCRRPFKPEKLCSHMRSCKGVKQRRSGSGKGDGPAAIPKFPCSPLSQEHQPSSEPSGSAKGHCRGSPFMST